jgi:hypothetical protein
MSSVTLLGAVFNGGHSEDWKEDNIKMNLRKIGCEDVN